MRINCDWNERLYQERVASEHWNTAIELRNYRYKLKQKGLLDVERIVYLRKEYFVREALWWAPWIFRKIHDDKYHGMILIHNLKDDTRLHYPKHKMQLLSSLN
jgi:hypothetical protein